MSKNIVINGSPEYGFCKGFEQAGFETKRAIDFDTEVAQTHNFRLRLSKKIWLI